ncbi:MAG: glutaminase [Odoribacter splanchnicus]
MPHIISSHCCRFLRTHRRLDYTSGIPVKPESVAAMGCLPGVFGIAAFAPPLDDAGNSVKAQAAIKYIARELGVNVFSGDTVEIIK